MADNMVKTNDFLENEIIDLSEDIKLVSPTDTPLTTLLMSKGATVPATDITVTWRERKLNETRGTLKKEGDGIGEAIKSSRSTLSNVCQIIEKVIEVSGTAEAVGETTFEDELIDRLIEVKRDMEWYFLNGVRAEENESTPRQMNGLVNLVNNDNVVDGTAGLSESLIEDTLYQLWTHESVKEYYAFVNKDVKRQINDLYRNSENVRINVSQGMDQSVGITVQRIVSDFGTLNLVLDRHMDVNTMLIVNLDQVQIAELRGTFFEMLPCKGDSEKGHVMNESSIKLLDSYSGAKIINIPVIATENA